MNRKIKTKNYKGFSFIEGIISVFLISIGMIGVMKLMNANLSETFDSRDQIIASLLSQEGIELVRNMRDNNWAEPQPTFGYFPSGSSRARCIIDYNNILNCGATSISKNLYLDSNNYYDHSVANPTKFRRRIELIYCNSSGTCDLSISKTSAVYARIKSVVTWGTTSDFNMNANTISADDANCNSATKCTYAETVLYKWAGM